jgi:hypothetical protein
MGVVARLIPMAVRVVMPGRGAPGRLDVDAGAGSSKRVLSGQYSAGHNATVTRVKAEGGSEQ